MAQRTLTRSAPGAKSGANTGIEIGASVISDSPPMRRRGRSARHAPHAAAHRGSRPDSSGNTCAARCTAAGIRVSRAPIRTGGDDSGTPLSTTRATISAPTPPVVCASWTTTKRPVRWTLARMESRSSGRIHRASITSALRRPPQRVPQQQALGGAWRPRSPTVRCAPDRRTRTTYRPKRSRREAEPAAFLRGTAPGFR